MHWRNIFLHILHNYYIFCSINHDRAIINCNTFLLKLYHTYLIWQRQNSSIKSSNSLSLRNRRYQYRAAYCPCSVTLSRRKARHDRSILCCVIKTVLVDFLKQGTRRFMRSIRRRGPSHQFVQVADSQTTDYSPYEAVAAWFTCGYCVWRTILWLCSASGQLQYWISPERNKRFRRKCAGMEGNPRNFRNSGRN